jgi:hypothetical protein
VTLLPLIVFVGQMSEIGPNLSYAQPNRFVLRLESMGGHPRASSACLWYRAALLTLTSIKRPNQYAHALATSLSFLARARAVALMLAPAAGAS